jgi:hypothetical protein
MSEVQPERRKGYNELHKEIDTHAQKVEDRLERFIKKALIAFGIIGIFCVLGIFGLGLVVRYNSDQSEKIETIAKRAEDRSQSSVIKIELEREKVCSQSSNRRIACRALFERLAGSLSEKQRIQLACDVIKHLRGSVAKTLRDENLQCKEAP